MPHSLDVQRRLAKFKLDNVNVEEGVRAYDEAGLLLRIPRVRRQPVIDGVLDDEVWKSSERVTTFYQRMQVMRTLPDTGKTEALVAYSDSSLYFGFGCYNEDVSALRARKTNRDEFVWEDEFAAISFRTGITEQRRYATFINTVGNWVDTMWEEGIRGRDGLIWNGDQTVAAHVGSDFWSVEMKLPFSSVDLEAVDPGDLWFMSVSFGRTKTSSGGGWIPNHGISSPAAGLARFME